MAVCGAVVLMMLYHHRLHRPLPEARPEEGVRDFDLPVPFAVTDEVGDILAISDALLEIAGISRETALASNIALLLPPGEGTAMLGEKAWNVLQQPMKEGRICFRLEPKALSDAAPQADSFVDPLTGLHTRGYAMQRLEEEQRDRKSVV